jgi:hypothetical protein
MTEVRMNMSKSLRQLHRWLSITFTLAVILNFVAVRPDEPALGVRLLALIPLALLLLTGLYLFALPYANKWRRAESE